MAEVEKMTDEQLKATIKEMESSLRKEKIEIRNVQGALDGLNKRVKENRDKLKLNTQLPYMIANVGEILEPEDEEDGDKDGSGFNVKKTDKKKVKKNKKHL